MMQYILTGIIVFAAVIIAVRKIYLNLLKKKDGCGGCESDSCSGCPLDDLKQDIAAKNPHKLR